MLHTAYSSLKERESEAGCKKKQTAGVSIRLLASVRRNATPSQKSLRCDLECSEHAPRTSSLIRHASEYTSRPLACPAAESARKHPRPPEKSKPRPKTGA